MRWASSLRWPWLWMGSVPPEDSMEISAQTKPVVMRTEATFCMVMLSSSTRNQWRLRRMTDNSLTSISVGNRKLPLVHRLAWNDSVGMGELRSGLRAGASLEAVLERGDFAEDGAG